MSNPHDRLKIFVVEDSRGILTLLVRAIRSAGARLLGHSDRADEAISALSRRDPDVVIVDLNLRSGSGFSVLRWLQSHTHSILKVVFSNHARYRDFCFEQGADLFFDKSCDGPGLIQLIERLAKLRRNSVERSEFCRLATDSQ